MIDVQVGSKFGDLVVLELVPGSKNKHPLARCRCSCGRERTPRVTALRHGSADCCSYCSHKRGWLKRQRLTEKQRDVARRESIYKQNAKKKNIEWLLSKKVFCHLLDGACYYCAKMPALGIDRYDNNVGYTPDNSVSCCSYCNYAKRDLAADQFLYHVSEIHKHSNK